jgi:hypothetical protein
LVVLLFLIFAAVLFTGPLLLAAVPVLIWRKSGRRSAPDVITCGACGYDLSGLAAGCLCPECGGSERILPEPKQNTSRQRMLAAGLPLAGGLLVLISAPGWPAVVALIVFGVLIVSLLSQAHRVSRSTMSAMAVPPVLAVYLCLVFAGSDGATSMLYASAASEADAILFFTILSMSVAGWCMAIGYGASVATTFAKLKP